MSLIHIQRMDGTTRTVESNDAEQAHGVNAAGASLGVVPLGSAFAITPSPPDGPGWTWNFEQGVWLHQQTLNEAKLEALALIDNAAGAARLRYITDVPGQQATYMAKAEQAQAFIEGHGEPGPYVVAEADAMGTPPLMAAQAIMETAVLWDTLLGPGIEKARRAGKLAVGAALGSEAVQSAHQRAIAALAAF